MVTVGYIEGGQAGNVIPEIVKFGGTYRSLASQGLYHIQDRIKEVNMFRFCIPITERNLDVPHRVTKNTLIA